MIPFGDRQHRPVKNPLCDSDEWCIDFRSLQPRQDSNLAAIGTSDAAIPNSNLVRQQWKKGTSPPGAKQLLGKEFTRGIAFIKIDFQHQNLHCVDKHPVLPRSIHNLDAHRSLS